MSDYILQIRDLKKQYNDRYQALKGVSLDVREGEMVSIIGPSGAGKSTLIRCINRMIDPTSGQVVFDGVHMENVRGRELRRMRSSIGMIFQHYNLVGRTNVIKNVLYGKLGRFSQEDREEAVALIRELGLEEQMYKRADALSGGQMQRVGICRALMQHPRLLLADEPIASLDPKASQVVMEELRDAAASRGLACIVNLHQVEFAKEFTSRIIGIKAGQVVFDGPPEALSERVITNIYEQVPTGDEEAEEPAEVKGGVTVGG